MRSLAEFRSGKPGFYPDQAVYAEFACAESGLAFADLDGGTGLLFSVSGATRSVHFGAGRCCWYPQNNATAATLAADKYFAGKILEREGVATLGGDYFFLHDRHRAHRPAGHEREDAIAHFSKLGGTGFIKPLQGSRGDFAQAIRGEAALSRYLAEVAKYYDAILIQPVVSGIEYRIFLLDDEIVYAARKYFPYLSGDGVHSIRELLAAHNDDLRSRGLSPASLEGSERLLDTVLPRDGRWDIPGRMNLNAGGAMVLEAPHAPEALTVARRAARALGLRVAAVDLFVDIGGDAAALRVIEVNASPSIRLLEDSGRLDLILKIWRHTFLATRLL